jgi:hypothetical protein
VNKSFNAEGGEPKGSLLSSFWSLFRHQKTDEEILLRCSCNSLMWKGREEVKKEKHVGHTLKVATKGSFLEMVRIKLNLIK